MLEMMGALELGATPSAAQRERVVVVKDRLTVHCGSALQSRDLR
jgi:hypothetical protein